MAPLAGIVVGVALLLFGRRLSWVFVGGIGFLTGLEFAPEVVPGQPDWVILVAALVTALVGALLAVMAQAFVIGAIGFVAGGALALPLGVNRALVAGRGEPGRGRRGAAPIARPGLLPRDRGRHRGHHLPDP